MGPNFDFASLVDIGFVLFVTLTCARAVLSKNNPGEKSEAWRHELRALESSLRDLISAASTASYNLDKSLLRRQEELNDLLITIDKKYGPELEQIREATPQAAPRNPAPQNTTPRNTEQTDSTEFPNESWLEPRAQSQKAAPAAPTPQAAPTKRTEQPLTDRSAVVDDLLQNSIEVVVGDEKDKVSGFAGSQAWNEQEENHPFIDPIAYKIAKRLLSEGKEIHIVARKLELPVSEVRAIDSELRRAEAPDHETIESSLTHEISQELVLESTEPTTAPQNLEFDRDIAKDESQAEQQADEIQREVALL